MSLTPEQIITDRAVQIVFENTRFGAAPREVLRDNLKQVANGSHIGPPAGCCLCELGLAADCGVRNPLQLTAIGSEYLRAIHQQESGAD